MDRAKEVKALRTRLMRLHSPRLQMLLIVALTVAAGFLASVSLHDIGMLSLAQRYALSVTIAYLIFLLLLRSWVRLHDKSLDIGSGADSDSRHGHDGSTSKLPGSDPVTDALPGDVGDTGEAVLVLLAIAVLGGAVFSALWVIWIAPTLLAELLIDILLGARLYRRLRGIESADWLRTALRRTALPFLLVLLTCAVLGATVQHFMPEASTLGDALRMRD